jgi:hypothetical protein
MKAQPGQSKPAGSFVCSSVSTARGKSISARIASCGIFILPDSRNLTLRHRQAP